MTIHVPEILAPAPNLESLRLALHYGADAVYCGGEAYSLRAKADNFTFAELAEGIDFAHQRGKKVYVTANIYAHNRDIAEAESYFLALKEIAPDGILISDPGMFRLAKRLCPDLSLHISTQANTTNYESVRFWRELGADRVVLARELTFPEIREIREASDPAMAIEAFVHGAMCISYSGRCLISNVMTGRDSNRGECTHPCRWKYSLVEEQRPGEYFPVEENERGTYFFHSKDLCMIEHIPELVSSGIDSFKIEGRMKSDLYVATIVRAYRRAVNDYLENPDNYRKNLPWYTAEVAKTTNRGFCTGFFFGKPDADSMVYTSSTYRTGSVYLGTVEAIADDGSVMIRQKNKLSVGETIEIMKPDGRNLPAKLLRLRDHAGLDIESAPHPKEQLHLTLSEPADAFDVLRRNP